MMRRSLTIACAVLALSAAVAEDAVAEKAGKDWSHHMGKLKFTVGYAKGLEKAKAEHKPVMLFITTTWCGWCKKLAADTFTDEAVLQALDAFVPVLVDGDVEKDICQKYQVNGFPNLRFVTEEGEEFGGMPGYAAPEKFLAQLQPILEKVGPAKPPPPKDWSAHTGKLAFAISYAKGMEQAKGDGKPVLFFVTTSGNADSRKLAESVFSKEEVVKALSAFTLVLVDGEIEQEACGKLGIEGYPSLRFVGTDGAVLGSMDGCESAEALLAQVKLVQEKLGK